MSGDARRAAYLRQTGRRHLTPRQRRRALHKERRAASYWPRGNRTVSA